MTENEDTLDTAEEIQGGQYQHTFMEIWENIINSHIKATEAPLDLSVAASILDAYPWLTHADLAPYRSQRVALLTQAKNILLEEMELDKGKVKLYKELEEDWTKHKDLYMLVIASWDRLTIEWGNSWAAVAEADTPDPVTHAAIADISGFLLNNEYGLTEGLKTLKGFSFDGEDRVKLDKLTGLTDE